MSNATMNRGVSSSANRFRDRALARRRRPWRRVLVTVLVLALVAGAVWAVGWSRALAVRQVEVSGVSGAERAAVADLVEVPAGTPLVRVDTAAVEERVRSQMEGDAARDIRVECADERQRQVQVVTPHPARIREAAVLGGGERIQAVTRGRIGLQRDEAADRRPVGVRR